MDLRQKAYLCKLDKDNKKMVAPKRHLAKKQKQRCSRSGGGSKQSLSVLVILLLVVILLLILSRSAGIRSEGQNAASVSCQERVLESGVVVRGNVQTPAGSVAPVSGEVVEGLELPVCLGNDFVIQNRAGRYTLRYDTTYRQPQWVAYVLTGAEVKCHGVKRQNCFRSDPEVVGRGFPTAQNRDYRDSGYDRGHLLPSADRDDTPEENRTTFYFSNIAPQRAGLNRGAWKELEEYVREMAMRCDTLWIVTGPVLKPGLARMGRNRIGIPASFYKTILTRSKKGYVAVAFLLPNREKLSTGFRDYTLSVDSLERVLNLDLFPKLPDDQERTVEAHIDRSFWFAAGGDRENRTRR